MTNTKEVAKHNENVIRDNYCLVVEAWVENKNLPGVVGFSEMDAYETQGVMEALIGERWEAADWVENTLVPALERAGGVR